MRTTLISSAIAISVASVGFAAAAGASGPREEDSAGQAAVAAAPTTVPFDLGSLGLTPEQLTCLTSNVGAIDLNDMTSIMTLMTQCGINPLDLVTGGTSPTLPAVGTETSVPGAAADLAGILKTMGIDEVSADCIENGLLGATSLGDTEALGILQSCGLTLSDLLTGVVAINEMVVSGSVPTPTLAAVPTTASGVTTASPLVQQLIDSIREQYGIELTPEQASCLLDNISGIDPEDLSAMLTLMEQCGISLSDLAG